MGGDCNTPPTFKFRGSKLYKPRKVIPMSVYEAGVDALTCSMMTKDPKCKAVEELVTSFLEAERDNGNLPAVVSTARTNGIRCGSSYRGRNGSRSQFECKGWAADELARYLRETRPVANCTRIDFQVTYARPVEARAYRRYLRDLTDRVIESDRSTAPGHAAAYQNRDGGATCYLHTADRSRLFRTYNKAAESPGKVADDAWRAELQLRNKRAQGALGQLMMSGGVEWLSKSFVVGACMELGLNEPWMADTTPLKAPSRLIDSDTEKRLQWFIHTAIPVARKLHEGGVLASALVPLIEEAMSASMAPVRDSLLKVWEPEDGLPNERG